MILTNKEKKTLSIILEIINDLPKSKPYLFWDREVNRLYLNKIKGKIDKDL